MGRVIRIISYLLSIPKSIYFNFRCLPFRNACKLPFYIHYNVRLGELHKGIISIEAPLSRFMIKYGLGGTRGISSMKSQIWLQTGTITFKGKASFAEGCSIRNNGQLLFGDNFGAGKNCFISCAYKIVFGDGIMMAWNGTVRDSDGHTILYEGVANDSFKSVYIGNHVWLAANTTVLKGSQIMDNSVVAYGSIVTRSFEEGGVLIGGTPAKVIREHVNWEE